MFGQHHIFVVVTVSHSCLLEFIGTFAFSSRDFHTCFDNVLVSVLPMTLVPLSIILWWCLHDVKPLVCMICRRKETHPLWTAVVSLAVKIHKTCVIPWGSMLHARISWPLSLSIEWLASLCSHSEAINIAFVVAIASFYFCCWIYTWRLKKRDPAGMRAVACVRWSQKLLLWSWVSQMFYSHWNLVLSDRPCNMQQGEKQYSVPSVLGLHVVEFVAATNCTIDGGGHKYSHPLLLFINCNIRFWVWAQFQSLRLMEVVSGLNHSPVVMK